MLTPGADAIGTLGQPAFLARRQQHMNAVAEITLRLAATAPGTKAGLVAYQDEAHYYFVGVVDEGGRRVLRVERRASARDPVQGVALASAPVAAPEGPIRLRVTARGGTYDFAYAFADGRQGGGWRTLLAGADGTILSTSVAGGFTGVVIGPHAYAPR